MPESNALPLLPYQAAGMHSYLSQPIGDPSGADVAVVFGRHDPRPAKAAARLWHSGSVLYIVPTGGKGGKDAGALGVLDMAEATYAAAVLTAPPLAIPVRVVHIEDQAANGFQNCELSIDLILAKALPHAKVVIVAHSTSLLRLTELFKHVASKRGFEAEVVAVPSDYPFDPTNPADQAEAIAEMNRLATWPAKGWLGPQPNLPRELAALAV